MTMDNVNVVDGTTESNRFSESYNMQTMKWFKRFELYLAYYRIITTNKWHCQTPQCIQLELDCQTIQLAKSTHKSKANPTGKVNTSKWVKPKPPPAPKTKLKTVQKPPPAPTKSNDDYKKQSTCKSPVYDGNDVSNPSFGLSAESKAKQASKYM
eukprot:550133_1